MAEGAQITMDDDLKTFLESRGRLLTIGEFPVMQG